MNKLFSLILAVGLSVGAAFGQVNTLYSTTLAVAAASTDGVLYVTSATNMAAPSPAQPNPAGSQLYVISPGNPRGEVVQIQSIGVAAGGSTPVNVARGRVGVRSQIPAGATILFGPPNWFRLSDPSGGCVTAAIYISPVVNVLTGAQWLCSPITLSWVPSWGNAAGDSFSVTAAVASAAGAILPTGPLFHVTGALAITGFTIPVGFVAGSFSIIPDGTFTTTTAGNIALASTAVVNKLLTFTWDATNSKFIPSY